MDTDERKSENEETASASHHVPWYEKAFKIQILLLVAVFATRGP
jgi:hypothetical protein